MTALADRREVRDPERERRPFRLRRPIVRDLVVAEVMRCQLDAEFGERCTSVEDARLRANRRETNILDLEVVGILSTDVVSGCDLERLLL